MPAPPSPSDGFQPDIQNYSAQPPNSYFPIVEEFPVGRSWTLPSGPIPPTPPPVTVNYDNWDYPDNTCLRIATYNNQVAVAYCVVVAPGTPPVTWDLWVAVNRSPLKMDPCNWQYVKIETALAKTNIGLLWLPNGILFLTYDLPDGVGGYKAVRRLNTLQGDPAGWSATADWTGHGCLRGNQAARVSSACSAQGSVYKFRVEVSYINGDNGHFSPVKMSRLKSTDGTDWTNEVDITVSDESSQWANTDYYVASSYYGGEFDLLYSGYFHFWTYSIKVGDPYNFPVPPTPNTNSTRLSDTNHRGDPFWIVYGSALGSDNVRWHLTPAKVPGEKLIIRDRSRTRVHDYAPNDPFIVYAERVTDASAAIVNTQNIFNICTLGAIPIVVSKTNTPTDATLNTIISKDGGYIWTGCSSGAYDLATGYDSSGAYDNGQ